MAGRDPWDIPTPTQGAPTQALTDEEYARYLAYSQRFATYGSTSAGPSNLPSPLPSNPPSHLPSPHRALIVTPPRPSPLSRQTSRRSERSGGGGGGGCCGGDATNASSPQRTRSTPMGSPGYRRSGTSTPRGASRRLTDDPTATPTGNSYTCNALGDIVENRQGKEVLQKMHEYLFTVFRRDVLVKWDDIQESKKNYLIELLCSEFPQPPHLQFDASRMLKKAAKIMRSRRSELNDRVRDGRDRPTWCDEDLWEELVERLNANPDMGSQHNDEQERLSAPHRTSEVEGGRR